MRCLVFAAIVFCGQARANDNWKELLEEADSLSESQNYDSAIVLGKLALDHLTSSFGPEDTLLVPALSALGRFGYFVADHILAESSWTRELAIREAKLSSNQFEIAKNLNNLGTLYISLGRYDRAESYFLRGLAIFKNELGPKHLFVSRSILNLANLYVDQERLREAESLLVQSKSIAEIALKPNSPELAYHFNSLGGVLHKLGRYDEAEVHYLQALPLWEEAFGKEHANVAATLSNLSVACKELGRFDDMANYSARALSILEKSLGSDHPDVGKSLINIANYHLRQREIAEAEPLVLRALKIFETSFGPTHPHYALGLFNLSIVALERETYAKADSLCLEVLRIQGEVLGENHPDIATSLELLSTIQRLSKQVDKASASALRAARIRRRNLVDNLIILSEHDALAYSHRLRKSVGNYLTCFFERNVRNGTTDKDAIETVLLTKGVVSDEIFDRAAVNAPETDSTGNHLKDSLKQLKYKMSALMVESSSTEFQSQQQTLDSLSRLAARLETDLSKHSASFRRHRQAATNTLGELVSKLPASSVLIEYMKYDHHYQDPETTVSHYLVTAITSGADVEILDLGVASEIESMVQDYRRDFLRLASSGFVVTDEDQSSYLRLAQRLSNAIWEPIRSFVASKDLVLIAPDGLLNLVSFAGLIEPNGHFLIEEFALQYLAAGRDLMRLPEESQLADGLLAMGDPDYDASVAERLVQRAGGIERIDHLERQNLENVRSNCDALDDIDLIALPGTRKEVEVIASDWSMATSEPVAVYTGALASEERFKAEAQSARVIHLATHGYFFGENCASQSSSKLRVYEMDVIKQNPLLLSGLFLAGANLHGQGADSAGAEDGILTAYEVSAMDLSQTEMVVLSACETGLGSVQMGEGVYGLRRAFQMAGVGTIISALWPVSDHSTSSMMRPLYNHKRTTFAGAMRQSQLEEIKRLRTNGLLDHPVKWAAFVVVGSL